MLNFKVEDKMLIEGEKNHHYKYFEFTEVKIKDIIKKNINDVSKDEWFYLIQMLYPKNLIASGLFQPILIFEIKDGYRVDPPIKAYDNLTECSAGSKSLFECIYEYIIENDFDYFQSEWKEMYYKIKERSDKDNGKNN